MLVTASYGQIEQVKRRTIMVDTLIFSMKANISIVQARKFVELIYGVPQASKFVGSLTYRHFAFHSCCKNGWRIVWEMLNVGRYFRAKPISVLTYPLMNTLFKRKASGVIHGNLLRWIYFPILLSKIGTSILFFQYL